jgi:N-acyl-D-amino-acid deacylase
VEIVVRVTEGGGAGIVNFGMSEEDVREIMQYPWVATASDGRAYLPDADRPHPRSYGTFPRKIGLYCLREEVLPLEQAVRSASGLPADILGLADRGYLRPGQAADIVVFDAEAFIDTATFDSPHQYARGVKHVFVNGTIAIADGHPTGALAGRALRKGHASE